MHDKTFREPTVTEQVMIVTLREVIEGMMYHNENVRLSDALNAEAKQHSRYVSLKDAIVYSIATGREILRTSFLVVSHSHIIYMTPKAAVRMATHPGLEEANGRAADAEMTEDEMQPTTPEIHWHAVAPAGIPAAPGVVKEVAAEAAATAESPKAPLQPPSDKHITSRQAMLAALAAIRAHAEDHRAVMGAAGRDLD